MPDLQPQLVMRRANLSDLPPIELPDDVTIRGYQSGDSVHWRRIVAAAFGWQWAPEDFELRLRGAAPFRPERMLFVCCEEYPVGTATVWQVASWGGEVSFLHMVAVVPQATGRALGYLVSLACLHVMATEGFGAAMLQTDDFRLPAVRTYLRLGFLPFLVHENQRERWAAVLGQIGRADLVARRGLLDMPIAEPPGA